MKLADKIIEERKKNGWSQEELAEQLDVSRQSVSKWESAQSVPDLNRILQMADLFGVSTDYLLKDELEDRQEYDGYKETSDSVRNVRKVSMEEAVAYLKQAEENAPLIALGVSLCIVSPIPLIVLSGLAGSRIVGISENAAGGIGVVVLLLLVACAVFLFVRQGNRSKQFEYLETEEIETAYGVTGLVREKKNEFSGKYAAAISIGVVLCILSSVPLLLSAFLTEKEYVIVAMVGVLLFIVAVAVNMFVRVCTINGSYDRLLQEGDYTREQKKASRKIGLIGEIYWGIMVAIYLGVSFVTMRWDLTWIIWPVAGVLFGAVTSIVKLISKAE